MLGLIIGAAVDLLINLVAAAIQQQTFANQFSTQALGGLVGLTLIGLLIGYWLGGPAQLSAPSTPQVPDLQKSDTTTITRLRALWSHIILRGKGIHLRDVFLIGSTTDIDTKD
jgi:hypothetical protein